MGIINLLISLKFLIFVSMTEKIIVWSLIFVFLCIVVYVRALRRKTETFSIHFDNNPYKVGDVLIGGTKKEELIVVKSYPTRVIVKRKIK